MFKILKYDQVTEKKEEEGVYWKVIQLPNIYPSKNLVSNWIDKYEDGIKKKIVECTIRTWDRHTMDYETDEVEIYVNDVYENEGYIIFVDGYDDPLRILGRSIRVKRVIKRKRKYSKEDPYGEENWD